MTTPTKQSKPTISQAQIVVLKAPDVEVLMEYYYTKIKGEVYQIRRFDKGKPEAVLTPYKEIPFVEANL